MPSTHEYGLLEFTSILAKVELEFSQKLQEKIQTFTNSRFDLPLKRLNEISNIHRRIGRNLNEIDPKNNENINLWKFCNIYSAASVDLDKAMRETRTCLRTKIQNEENKNVVESKPKSRNFLSSGWITKQIDQIDEKFKKFSKEERMKRNEAKNSRKNTESSLESNPEERREHSEICRSTPVTPTAIKRSIRIIQANKSIENEIKVESSSSSSEKTKQIPNLPKSPPPPIPVSSFSTSTRISDLKSKNKSLIDVKCDEKSSYAPTVYSDLQQKLIQTSSRPVLIEEHSLKHSDESNNCLSTVRIRTNIDVSTKVTKNPTLINAYESTPHYMNIRPSIAQKPKSKENETIQPTLISVECSPIETNLNFKNNDVSLSQSSSSSAYSSNVSSIGSSSNITSFNIETRPNSETEHARLIRIDSANSIFKRF